MSVGAVHTIGREGEHCDCCHQSLSVGTQFQRIEVDWDHTWWLCCSSCISKYGITLIASSGGSHSYLEKLYKEHSADPEWERNQERS